MLLTEEWKKWQQRSRDVAKQHEDAELTARRIKIINAFNIVRMEDHDYITLNGMVISRAEDHDLIDRIDEFRKKAMEREGLI